MISCASSMMSTVCSKERDVERAVGAAELHQVQRGEVAGRVVDVHVLGAVRHDDAVDDVGVVQRLGEVVDHLLSVVLTRDQRGAGLRRGRALRSLTKLSSAACLRGQEKPISAANRAKSLPVTRRSKPSRDAYSTVVPSVRVYEKRGVAASVMR